MPFTKNLITVKKTLCTKSAKRFYVSVSTIKQLSRAGKTSTDELCKAKTKNTVPRNDLHKGAKSLLQTGHTKVNHRFEYISCKRQLFVACKRVSQNLVFVYFRETMLLRGRQCAVAFCPAFAAFQTQTNFSEIKVCQKSIELFGREL